MSDDYADQSLLDLFREEAETQLGAMSEGLVALESADDKAPLLEELMRAAHSMKGAARIVGIDPIVKLAHVAEDIFVAAQRDELTITAPIIDVLLKVTDFIGAVSRAEGTPLSERGAEVEHLLGLLTQARAGELAEVAAADPALVSEGQDNSTDAATANSASTAEQHQPSESESYADQSLLELFCEEAETQLSVMSEGLVALEGVEDNAALLEELMRAAHSMKGAARIVGIDPIVKLAHVVEDIFVAAQRDELHINAPIIDVLLKTTDFIGVVSRAEGAPLGERSADVEHLVALLNQARAGELIESDTTVVMPVENNDTHGQALNSTPVASEKVEAVAQTPAATNRVSQGQSIRISVEALERLTGLAAEATVEASRIERMMDDGGVLRDLQRTLRQSLSRLNDAIASGGSADELDRVLGGCVSALDAADEAFIERDERLELFSRRLSSMATRLSREAVSGRMLPFSTILRGYPRLVRDLGRELGKTVRLDIRGEETMIDREILERLDSALNHIVRNGLDHGIEPSDIRVAAGKPAEATLSIQAFHQSGRLRIQVREDGRGIDAESLRAAVIARGIETPETAAALAVDELYEFLFLPGFSTANKITEVSGRGVGLDSVRSIVQQSGGSIKLVSALGQGTTFDLELPVTRSVARVLLMGIGADLYALPIARIANALQIERAELKTVEGKLYFEYEGDRIAVLPAAEILELDHSSTDATFVNIIVVEEGQRSYGLAVDRFIGEQQLLVRPLDPRLGDVPNVAALSTDEDGEIVLILDTDELLRSMDAAISGGRLTRQSALSSGQQRLRRLLVVDDSLTVRQAERQLLENAGYDVDVAVDGLEGWSAVRLVDYDLVVSDVDMPRMNGIDLVKRIRSEGPNPDIPVIIVSYKDREEDRLRGLDAGANYYLAKGGFSDTSLLDAVADLIGPAIVKDAQ